MITVVLPFKPGDDLWIVDEKTGEIMCEKGGIAGVVVYENDFKIVSKDEYLFTIGKDGVFTSQKDAEEYIKQLKL